ncbi:Transposase, IS116/IS110/IS902 like protein, partial [Aduncisulcus paluster]
RSIAIPSEREEAFRALSRRRHQLTDSIRRVKQRIRSLFLALGVAEPAGIDSWGKAAVLAIEHQPLSAGATETRDSLLSELKYFIIAQKEVDTKLELLAKEQDEAIRIAAMRSVPGVGRVVATTFAAEIFNPKRFNHSKEVTAYLGLAPIVQQSGASKGKANSSPSRSTEATKLAGGGSMVPQKAIAALARKLAALLWKLSLPVETA